MNHGGPLWALIGDLVVISCLLPSCTSLNSIKFPFCIADILTVNVVNKTICLISLVAWLDQGWHISLNVLEFS